MYGALAVPTRCSCTNTSLAWLYINTDTTLQQCLLLTLTALFRNSRTAGTYCCVRVSCVPVLWALQLLLLTPK